MDVTITTLTKRHKAHDLYSQMIEPSADPLLHRELRDEVFVQLREWCWQTFGPSVELDIVIRLKRQDRWCWDSTPEFASDVPHRRIYLNLSEFEQQQFMQRWA